jgi:hypothetical protein
LGRRDAGAVLQEHLAESVAMAHALEREALGDVVVDNETSVTDAAEALLERLGWE